MDLSVFFAGTGGSAPTARRGLPAILLRRGGDRILFDCGEGTQRQLLRSVGLLDLTEVYLTHYHADHWFGLPGMLKTFDLRGREAPLRVHGPPGLVELMKLATRLTGRVGYELELVELARGDVIERDAYRIAPFPVDHRGAAYGYAIFEAPRPGHFDPRRAIELGLAPGPEFGRVQRGETVRGVAPDDVMGSPRAGRKVVLSGDTRPSPALAVAAHEADLLVHEATFLEEDAAQARDRGHSTARQAGALAREAGVRALALVHGSTRYLPRALRDEARKEFPDTWLPRDFDTIEIPFPERGRPALVHWAPAEPLRAEGAVPAAEEASAAPPPRSAAAVGRLIAPP